MQKLFYVFLLLSLICTSSTYAQLSDLARIDYTIIPMAKSDVEYTRFRALFNYPIKLKDNDTYLLIGLDYSNIQLQMEKSVPFDTRDLNDFQLLGFNFAYTAPLKNDWRLGVRFEPGFSTNLVADAVSLDDVVLSGTVLFIRQGEEINGKRTKLVLGVSYAGNSGFDFPLPLVSYYKKFRPDWSYSIGIPKSNLQYHFSEKNRLKLYAQLDGFTSNLQRDVPFVDGEAARSINLSLIISGLQYEHYFTKNLQFYARAAYILTTGNELRDENRDPIFEFDNKARIYLRTGVRFKI